MEQKEESEYDTVDYLIKQVGLIEIKIKYNDAMIEYSKAKEMDTKKITDVISLYETLLPHLKEKHIITQIIDLKYEMEFIELKKKCDKLYYELNTY